MSAVSHPVVPPSQQLSDYLLKLWSRDLCFSASPGFWDGMATDIVTRACPPEQRAPAAEPTIQFDTHFPMGTFRWHFQLDCEFLVSISHGETTVEHYWTLSIGTLSILAFVMRFQ
jgi:hypothetical protein